MDSEEGAPSVDAELDPEIANVLDRAFPGARVVASARLNGGVSARAVRAELIGADGAAKSVVVRRPQRPSSAERRRVVDAEFRVLSVCTRGGIRVPRPCSVDYSALAVVLEYVDGEPDFSPVRLDDTLEQLAAELARIHAIPITTELESLGRCEHTTASRIAELPSVLDHSLDEPGVRAILERLWPWQPSNAAVLLHGDYWPGNTLWKDSRLVAVIDWEASELGDPLADLATTRLDLWWAFGEAAMHEFTAGYQRRTNIDWANLAKWELVTALRPMSNLARWASAYAAPPILRPDITESTMADVHRRFVEQAMRRLQA